MGSLGTQECSMGILGTQECSMGILGTQECSMGILGTQECSDENPATKIRCIPQWTDSRLLAYHNGP
jgi:hypothetical protein